MILQISWKFYSNYSQRIFVPLSKYSQLKLEKMKRGAKFPCLKSTGNDEKMAQNPSEYSKKDLKEKYGSQQTNLLSQNVQAQRFLFPVLLLLCLRQQSAAAVSCRNPSFQGRYNRYISCRNPSVCVSRIVIVQKRRIRSWKRRKRASVRVLIFGLDATIVRYTIHIIKHNKSSKHHIHSNSKQMWCSQGPSPNKKPWRFVEYLNFDLA